MRGVNTGPRFGSDPGQVRDPGWTDRVDPVVQCVQAMATNRRQWTIDLIDEAIFAASDKLALLLSRAVSSTVPVLDAALTKERILRLQQVIEALRADREKLWHREERSRRAHRGKASGAQ